MLERAAIGAWIGSLVAGVCGLGLLACTNEGIVWGFIAGCVVAGAVANALGGR